jgi:ribonucleotide reductase alpha subunit
MKSSTRYGRTTTKRKKDKKRRMKSRRADIKSVQAARAIDKAARAAELKSNARIVRAAELYESKCDHRIVALTVLMSMLTIPTEKEVNDELEKLKIKKIQ